MITLLDGAMGTELERLGIRTDGPAWSARAIGEAPDTIRAIHRAYADAGAEIHTAATFRTAPRALGDRWQDALLRAVALARSAVPADRRIAGSVAPLEDCWRPERSPAEPGPEHRRIAEALAGAGVDLLLCETFARVDEALIAVESGVRTGLPTWISFTAGFRADLMEPAEMGIAARRAVERGAGAVLVNCVPASRTLPYVQALGGAGVPFGACANAGLGEDAIGPEAYLDHARTWAAEGATLIGGCCGTGPRHISALAVLVRAAGPGRRPEGGGADPEKAGL